MNATHITADAIARRHTLLSLGVLLGATLAGCASAPAPRSAQAPQMPEARPEQPQRNDIALFAMGLLDTRYRWGGRGPATGFDCSGLVSHVFQQAAGMRVQGTSAELGQKARPVATSDLLPGDLVFFNTLGRPFSHMGIFIGDGKFVHAPRSNSTIRVERLDNSYFAARYQGGRTLFDE